jgi:hypothetical protein
MVNGVRGLCSGLGPALFGCIFYLFKMKLDFTVPSPVLSIRSNLTTINTNSKLIYSSMFSRDIPGPPFLFGALLATVGLMFSLLLPNSKFDSHRFANDTRTIEQKARLLDIDDDTNDSIQLD